MLEETKYESLKDHENYIFQKYVKRKKLGRLPPRDRATGIIEFESDQDEYWLPPNKRHAMLLMSGVGQPDILSEVSGLDQLRVDRKKSVSDKDALAFAIALTTAVYNLHRH